MKKVLISILIFVIILSASLSITFAETQIIEKPDIKITIDGKQGVYTSVPINVNGRTLLPLRELLVNLGVQNDNNHIIWNGDESSVTVKKDLTTIYLKVGSTNATVNNQATTLDAASVNYKGKVYIPARFIAQSFGMQVEWSGASNAVSINTITNQVDLTDSEKAIINSFKEKAIVSPVDGGYSNPLQLSEKQAVVYIVFVEQEKFNSFNSLTENAKKVYMNDVIQENIGSYSGCEIISAILHFQDKNYFVLNSKQQLNAKDSELVKIEGGEKAAIVVQDKNNNKYYIYDNN